LIATEAGSDRSKQVIDAKISAIHEMVRSKADSKTAAQAHSVRTTGSAALNLCSVAKGVVDVYWEVGCWEWDVAAGVVIVTESGGLVLSGSHDKSDFEPVNLFCRKYLAVRAANRKKQEHVVTQMREIIPAIDAPRAPVPGGFDA
jgi:myo-inositol-1(or 4)-monophosphatase